MTNNHTAQDGPESDQQDADDEAIRECQLTKNGERKADTAESSSTSSSTRKSGGGGYSADCSSSDQSSDGTRQHALSLFRLNLGSETTSEEASSQSDSPSQDGEQTEGKTTAPSELKKQGKRPRKNRSKVSSWNESISEADRPRRYRLKLKSPTFALDSTEAASKLDAESSSASSSHHESSLDGKRLPLPQWNGISISHPMDPRIDLSIVGTIHSSELPGTQQLYQTPLQNERMYQPETASLTVDSYIHLMEAVRPFFHSQGIALVHEQQQQPQQPQGAKNGSSSETLSSEGFTCFFTTTDSNGTKASEYMPASEMDKKVQAAPEPHHPAESDNDDDDSSMAVLARSKRKHGPQEESSNTSSSSSGEKHARIQDAPQQHHHQQHDHHANANHNRHPEQAAQVENNNVHHPVPPRIVTDVSSSNQTNTTTSGSGSGGNSGSNQGSSGSGNDGKGSSEELAKEDNSGEGTNEGSDGSTHRKGGISCLGGGPAHRHNNGVTTVHDQQPKLSSATKQDNEATRERKLLDKKRKRIEMRREYEAQQHIESSESSGTKGEQYFRPGRPVTLEQVLVFSKIPRIIVQGSPPFLVIHTNAAYCRLTGIDSHLVVGKPVSALLSLHEAITPNVPDDEQHAEGLPVDSNTGTEDVHAPGYLEDVDTSGRARSESSRDALKDVSLERLIATSGFGHIHVVHVNTKSHQMVGRNVTVFKDAVSGCSGPEVRRRDEESNDLTSSYEGGLQQSPPLACRISIAPIVSSSTAVGCGVVSEKGAETHQKGKRVKHHHGPEQDSQRKPPPGEVATHHRKYLPLQLVTHFVIQLQPQGEATGKNGSMASLSSNSISVQANLLGLTKEELQLQRDALAAADILGDVDMEADAEGSTSVSSEREAVAAIG